ncbi:MAG: hypothetical protein DRI57_04055 [Deltaproteobacteria bacterium]|nr:MAG: hypothetical protein DRI57_04055 [Deltaproteobacteria bacterium]
MGRAQTPGDFGPGWSLPQADVSVAATHIIGEGWTQNSGAGLWGMPVHTLAPSQRHLIVIRLSDTDVVRFEPEVSPNSSTIYPFEMISTKIRFTLANLFFCLLPNNHFLPHLRPFLQKVNSIQYR